jgi:hypothetical protein
VYLHAAFEHIDVFLTRMANEIGRGIGAYGAELFQTAPNTGAADMMTGMTRRRDQIALDPRSPSARLLALMNDLAAQLLTPDLA